MNGLRPSSRMSIKEWEKRAKRPGLQSVMSTRWTEQQCKNATEKLKTEVFSFLPVLNGKRILDVGCGIGRFTEELANNAAKVFATDSSSSMLAKAKRNLVSKETKIFKEPAHKLHFDNNFFDLIFEITVLQHIFDENMFRSTLNELKRVTSNKGLIFLCGEMANNDKVISPFTILRSIKTYAKAMKPWKLIKTKNHKCVTDSYKLTLWKL